MSDKSKSIGGKIKRNIGSNIIYKDVTICYNLNQIRGRKKFNFGPLKLK